MLWDLLETAGHVLDTPGAFARGLLAGKNPLPGVFDPAQRTYGRDLLEQYGLLGANEEGLDWGDAAGLGMEIATDPLNLFGGALFKRLLGKRALAKASNKAADVANVTADANNAKRARLLDSGGMPEEVAMQTKAVDETGRPVTTYHGTPHVYDRPDMAKMDPNSLFGPGYYTTEDLTVAGGGKPNAGYAAKNAMLDDVYETALKPEYQPADVFAYLERNPHAEQYGLTTPQMLRRWDMDLDPALLEEATRGQFGVSIPTLDEVARMRAADAQPLYRALAPDGQILGEGGNPAEAAEAARRWVAKFGDGNERFTVSREMPDPRQWDFYEGLNDLYRQDLIRPASPMNTRMQHLDVRSPFDMDAPLNAASSGGSPLQRLPSVYESAMRGRTDPDVLQEVVRELRDVARNPYSYNGEPVTGESLYRALQDMGMRHDVPDLLATKAQVNDLLRQSGYDAITHIGGGRWGRGLTGEEPHKVWISLNPDQQVYAPWIAPLAMAHAAKQPVPRVSPLLAALTGHNALARQPR